ncbi:MAG: fumarylacetoacetate hydrolase family protein [Flavobacteriales bacterium]|nr:fumarylacetoacetate hydrolase family protein [Flavobacteriales bacterium]
MKIICIGRNYSEHALELNNPIPSTPLFFMKPDSALLQKNKPFFYPSFSNNIHFEAELVIRINRLGKSIQEKFAHKYYNEIGLGIDFTARDLQKVCKENGHPWEIAKGFDGSAVLSSFHPIEKFVNLKDLNFSLNINGSTKQSGNSKDMIFNFDQIISYVSQFMTLKIGDFIFTGTPAGVGPVQIGDKLEGYLEDELVLKTTIK